MVPGAIILQNLTIINFLSQFYLSLATILQGRYYYFGFHIRKTKLREDK